MTGKELPEEKDRPEHNRQKFSFILRNKVPGESGCQREASESADGESRA